MKKFFAILILAALFVRPSLAVDSSVPDPTGNPKLTTREICNNVCFGRDAGGLFTCNQQCQADDAVRFPVGIDFLTKKIRSNVPPPLLRKFEFQPPNPRPGDDVTVTLTPETKDLEAQRLISSKFIYAFDSPADWTPVVSEIDPVRGVWETKFKVPNGANTLFYSIRLGDMNKNTFIVIPCNVQGDPRTSDTCFFPLVDDMVFDDPVQQKIDPALDIVKMTFGMDDRKFYFKLTAKSKIDPGLRTPQNAYYYMVTMHGPGRAPEVDPYNRTIFMLYAPYLGPAADCKVLMRNGHVWNMNTDPVKCKVDGDRIFFELSRKAINATAGGVFVTYAATGIILDEDHGIIVDYSPTASVRFDKKPIELGK